ncbi:MAG: hypothetical protein R3Y57_03160 [Erysipelotrichaceae bacterium]
MKIDRNSYYLGMTFAFVECVLNDAKEIALTHPLTTQEYDEEHHLHEQIIHENGLFVYWDDVLGRKSGIIYKYEESIQAYLTLRKQYNIIDHFEQFKALLSYNQVAKLKGYDYRFIPVIDSENWLFNLK